MAPTVLSNPSPADTADGARQLARSPADIPLELTSNIPRHALQPRQNPNQQGGIVAIPTVYQGLNAGPAPGAVVGIVLGSVLGFLFLIWLFWVLSNGGSFIRANQDEEESVVVTRRRDRSSRRSHRSNAEMATRTSPRRDRDRVYRSERVIRDFPPQREGSRSRVRETVIVDDVPPPRERRVEGDDIVEVIEEHSSIAPPRRKNRRGSGYRSVTNAPSSPPQMPGGFFRPVDPGLYAGGNYRPTRM